MNLDRPALAHGVDLLVGLPLEVHAVGVDAEQVGEVKPKFLFPRSDLRSFENHGRIEVADFLQGFRKQLTNLQMRGYIRLLFKKYSLLLYLEEF